MKWDKRFIELAYLVASWSKDNSTKCGAVIVDKNKRIVSVGFNGFPKNTNDDEKLYNNREEKYRRVIHAEKNAIMFSHTNIENCTMYVVPMPPCSQCAGMIIQSGITRLVTISPTGDQIGRWGYDFITTKAMFKEANVELYYMTKEQMGECK